MFNTQILSRLMSRPSIFGELPWARRDGLSPKLAMLAGPWPRSILHNAREQSADECKETPKAACLSQLFFNKAFSASSKGSPGAVWPIQECMLPVSSSQKRKACLENPEQFYFLISTHQKTLSETLSRIKYLVGGGYRGEGAFRWPMSYRQGLAGPKKPQGTPNASARRVVGCRLQYHATSLPKSAVNLLLGLWKAVSKAFEMRHSQIIVS